MPSRCTHLPIGQVGHDRVVGLPSGNLIGTFMCTGPLCGCADRSASCGRGTTRRGRDRSGAFTSQPSRGKCGMTTRPGPPTGWYVARITTAVCCRSAAVAARRSSASVDTVAPKFSLPCYELGWVYGRDCGPISLTLTSPDMKMTTKPPPEPPDPKTWPAFLAWFGRAPLTACIKIAAFLLLVIWFSHRAGWF